VSYSHAVNEYIKDLVVCLYITIVNADKLKLELHT